MPYTNETVPTSSGNGAQDAFKGFRNNVLDNGIFKAFFDPLGLFSAASAKWAPDDPFGVNDIKRSQFADPETQRIQAQMQAFLDKMNSPLDMNDPQVKALIANTQAAAGRDARNRGVNGGMAVTNTQQAVANAQTAELARRQQMYQQGLAQLGNLNMQAGLRQDNLYQNALDREQGRLNQLYSDRQKRLAGIEGLAGTVIGGLFGGPGGAQAGNAAGQMGGAQGAGQRQYVGLSY